jgi:hypothetical protein
VLIYINVSLLDITHFKVVNLSELSQLSVLL